MIFYSFNLLKNIFDDKHPFILRGVGAAYLNDLTDNIPLPFDIEYTKKDFKYNMHSTHSLRFHKVDSLNYDNAIQCNGFWISNPIQSVIDCINFDESPEVICQALGTLYLNNGDSWEGIDELIESNITFSYFPYKVLKEWSEDVWCE